MNIGLVEHWVHIKEQNTHVLRLKSETGTPGITISCRDKTFLFRRIIIDEFGLALKIEGSRPWPTGLRHNRRLRGLKNWLIAQYLLEAA